MLCMNIELLTLCIPALWWRTGRMIPSLFVFLLFVIPFFMFFVWWFSFWWFTSWTDGVFIISANTQKTKKVSPTSEIEIIARSNVFHRHVYLHTWINRILVPNWPWRTRQATSMHLRHGTSLLHGHFEPVYIFTPGR